MGIVYNETRKTTIAFQVGRDMSKLIFLHQLYMWIIIVIVITLFFYYIWYSWYKQVNLNPV